MQEQVVYEQDHRRLERRGEPTAGGAYAEYEVCAEMSAGGKDIHNMQFQPDTIPNVGVVGLTNEMCLAAVIDRLRCFQAGQFECDENALALDHAQLALEALESRTARRTEEGTEGTHEGN